MYGTLDQILKVLHEKDISVKQIIPCLTALSKKSQDVIANVVKKNIILWKKQLTTLKNPKWSWETTSRFSEEEKEEMSAGHVDVFCQNLGII